MADINIKYATADTITMTNTSLADGGWRCSAEVDNATNLYVDAMVSGNIQLLGTGTPGGTIDIYAIGLLADGTYFTAGIDASDKGITWGTTDRTSVDGEQDLKFLGFATTEDTDTSLDAHFGPFSVAQAFGGVLPKKWAIVIENNTTEAFHATGTNNEISYFGIEYTSV